MVTKKFTADSFVQMSIENRKKIIDWILKYKLDPNHVAFIEQTHFEDDPILEEVKLVVWTLVHHMYIPADQEPLYIYEHDDFGDLVYTKYAEMERDDFPWEVLA